MYYSSDSVYENFVQVLSTMDNICGNVEVQNPRGLKYKTLVVDFWI